MLVHSGLILFFGKYTPKNNVPEGATPPGTYQSPAETGLYYLQSRYYNPEMGRFINADNYYFATGQGFVGNNMFAYCLNNPVMYCDPSGTISWGTLFEGAGLLSVGIIACAAAITVASGGACTPVLIAACITFTAGGMTALNGTAEMVESVTDYNFMRDGLFNGDTEFYETQKTVFEATAEVGAVALGVSSGFQICFVAGTLILAAEGLQTIETVEVGDYVWAWDEETGKVALKQVVETFTNETRELVHVFVNGEEIVTTPEHPFYSPVRGWTCAKELGKNDVLTLFDGKYVTVEDVQYQNLEEPITVYNFEVQDYHTYYVGQNCVLVHNNCGGFNNIRTLKSTKIKGYTVTMDLEYGGSGIPNIHLKVGREKYIYYANGFYNSRGEQLFRVLRDSPIIQDALKKALDLIEKGWS